MEKDAYDYFVKADSVKLVGLDGVTTDLKTMVVDETFEFKPEQIKDVLDSKIWTDLVGAKMELQVEYKAPSGSDDLLKELIAAKKSLTGRSAQKSVYDNYSRGYIPPYEPYEPPLLQDQDYELSNHYKTYTDLGDHMALRIADDTGQNVNTVLRSLKESRRRGATHLNVMVLSDRYSRGPAYPSYVKLHPWEEFWSTFTYKPGFSFAYLYDIDYDQHKVYARMMVENIDRHGHFTPVDCYFKLPPWTNREEACLYTRNYVIWGLEQHEIDEWMLFNGERVFNPHDPKNAKLQIAR